LNGLAQGGIQLKGDVKFAGSGSREATCG
jgi:hypothetical protein